jgi:hypothetical protein
MKRLICIVIGVALLLQTVLLGGCAPGSQANKQAGKGATTGAVGGAVAGGLGSILFGGSFGRGLAAGAAIGAASGAATGAVSGAMADKDASRAPAKKAPPSTAPAAVNMSDFKNNLGPKNYEAATALAQCRHSDAIATAAEAYSTSTDAQQKAYALFIQAVSAEEQGNKRFAASLYPKIQETDPKLGGVDKVRADALEGVIKLQNIRKDNGLAPVCPSA